MKRHTIAYDHQIFSQQRFGGVSRYICELATRVGAQAGWRSVVVAPVHYNDHLAGSAASTLGLHLQMRIPRTSRVYRGANALLGPALMAAARADLLHRSYYTARPGRSRRPVVVTVHDMIHELFPDSFDAADSTSVAKRRCVASADHIVCVSHNTAADLMRLFGVPQHKITVTPLGFSSGFAPNGASPLPPRPARPYFLHVGHRFGYKNFARVLQAYSCSPLLRRDFDLVVFGGYPLSAEEQMLIEAMRIRPGAVRRVTGSDLELKQAYAGAHALVYASLYEGFGIPPLEAMSQGCPVVCSNTSSVPEVVGDAGEYFDPTDVGSIRSALEHLAEDDGRRSALIEAGHLRCRHFTWDACASATMRVYEHLLDR